MKSEKQDNIAMSDNDKKDNDNVDDNEEQKSADTMLTSSKKIELKSLTIDSDKLNMSDLRSDLSNAIELSLKNATCMKLLMWINTFLQINSKNQSIKSQNLSLSNDDNDENENKNENELLLDRIPLSGNLLSFLEELSPFETLHPPSDNFVAGMVQRLQ